MYHTLTHSHTHTHTHIHTHTHTHLYTHTYTHTHTLKDDRDNFVKYREDLCDVGVSVCECVRVCESVRIFVQECLQRIMHMEYIQHLSNLLSSLVASSTPPSWQVQYYYILIKRIPQPSFSRVLRQYSTCCKECLLTSINTAPLTSILYCPCSHVFLPTQHWPRQLYHC